jgi:hypothetical protein
VCIVELCDAESPYLLPVKTIREQDLVMVYSGAKGERLPPPTADALSRRHRHFLHFGYLGSFGFRLICVHEEDMLICTHGEHV